MNKKAPLLRLFSYKMTHDTGFAPNPFHGVLTLATCKPGIRRTKKKDDWVAGFSSKALSNHANRLKVDISPDALIYLGKIKDVMPIADYYRDELYQCKIPSDEKLGSQISCMGDNIYEPSPSEPDVYKQVSNPNHKRDDDKRHDVSGKNVLIFSEFYYLGQKGKPIPDDIKISRPEGPTGYGYKTDDKNREVTKLIEWVQNNFKAERNGYPCLWEGSQDDKKCGGCG